MKKFIYLFSIALLALTVAIPGGTGQAASHIRIRFEPNATSGIASGQLAPQGQQDYLLRAVAGQVMQVTLWPQGGARLSIKGADGSTLLSPGGELGWQGV
jgi:hypothetical protein